MSGHRGKFRWGISYIPGESFVHSLDPRTKLFVLVIVSIGSLLSGNPLIIGIFLATVLCFAAASGIFREWMHSMRILVPILIITILVDLFFSSSKYSYGTIFYSGDLWILHAEVSYGSVMFAISMVLRIMTIGGFSFLFIMTTPYNKFIKSLSLAGVPKTFTFSLGYALKSINSLSHDASEIIAAQRSRGLVFNRELLFREPVRILSIFVPMVVTVMNRADQVSDAMQCRGYGLNKKPTMYMPPVMEKKDYILLCVVILILAISILIGSFFVG